MFLHCPSIFYLLISSPISSSSYVSMSKFSQLSIFPYTILREKERKSKKRLRKKLQHNNSRSSKSSQPHPLPLTFAILNPCFFFPSLSLSLSSLFFRISRMVVSGRVSSTLLHPAVSPKQLAASTWDLAKSQHIHPTLVVLLSSCRGMCGWSLVLHLLS